MKSLSHLTGLRAVAALIVFISHSANEGVINSVFGYGFGKVGVIIFFVLSGFLMGVLYLHKDPSVSNLKYYLVSRVARILPLYAVLIVISYLIYNYFYEGFYYDVTTLDLLTSLLMIKAPSTFWTIPVEFQFYIVFMLFWWVGFRRGYLWGLPVLVLITSPVLLYLLLNKDVPSFLPKYAFSFFIGIFIAFYSKSIRSSRVFKGVSDKLGWLFLMLVFLNLPELRSNLGLNFGGGIYEKTWVDPLTWFVVLLLFLACVASSKSLNFLNFKPVEYLGKISYGFYLIHYPIIYFFKDFQLPNAIIFIGSFVVVILISSVFFHCLEKPAQKYISRVLLS